MSTVNWDKYRAHWDFIEEYLPNYDSDQDVAEAEILMKYLCGELDQDEDLGDIEYVETKYGTDKTIIIHNLVDIETSLFDTALTVFLVRAFH